jgi:hypothetical protein
MFTSLFLYNVDIVAFVLFVEIYKNISVFLNSTVNSEINAMFLLLQKMQLVGDRNNFYTGNCNQNNQ